jgi:malate dehydrogenase (oxaloacetate-decarboxylating)(NADP+)
MLDSKGVISTSRTDLNEQKKFFATSRTDIHTLAEAVKDADVFVGLSKGNVLSQDMVRSMAKDPVIFALANPVPEISYEDAMAARPDVLMSTGRTDYPNQINNVIGFPYIFRGALDVHATAINEEMKMAAVHAIADLAKKPVPDVVNDVYKVNNLKFGREYFIPKPVDPRLISEVSAAVAKAAIKSGVARKKIENWKQYKASLSVLLGQETKLTQKLYATAAAHPQRVVFAEAVHPTMLKAAVQAKSEGICQPILLGNDEVIEKMAKELDLNLEGIEIVNLRHPKEQERRERYARVLTEKRQRDGYTFQEANDKMFERNYFGMMMVETGDADAFITGLYTKYSNTIKVVNEVIGIRPEYKHFGTMHIINSPKGTLFVGDTLVNENPDTDTLVDIAKLSATAVRFFNEKPVISMISHSNFGSSHSDGASKVRAAVEQMQKDYPDLAIDGEMQISFALNKELRDEQYPFTRLKGKDVNTLVFPNLTSARSSYKMLQMLDADVEIIGPIQMGLNKPIHFIDFGASVRDVVNIVAVAVIDAYVDKIKTRINKR